MESVEDSTSALASFTVRRKRSSMHRVPRAISATSHCFNFLLPSTPVIDDDNINCEENPTSKNADDLNGIMTENKLKLKLKLGGVTHTIKSESAIDSKGDNYHSHGYNSEFQDEEQSLFLYKTKGNGIQPKHVQKTVCLAEIHQSRGNPSEAVNRASISDLNRKRKRGHKKRVLDDILVSDDEDEEIRYLEKLKSKRNARDNEAEDENEEEQELFVTQRMGLVDSFQGGVNRQITRTRALQSGKDASSLSGSGVLEFPEGLPSTPSKRLKPKLSEVDQQSKKAEAAQRRRIQSEKAARDAEAEAIKRILGQDSGRKKREDKIRKKQEELAQEREAKSKTLASNTIRWVIGPNGTTVTFSEDIGLPDLFKPATLRYPPPREKCVGPNCDKAYRYRDSKSQLPLCSFDCYKAIREKTQPVITC